MRVAHTVANLRSITPEEYFSEGWEKVEPEGFEVMLWRGLRAMPDTVFEEIHGLSQDSPGVLVRVDGVTLGCALSHKLKHPSCKPSDFWIPSDLKGSQSLLSRIAWAGAGADRVLFRTDKDGGFFLLPDPSSSVFPSKRGDQLYERVMKFHALGYNRSVFALGDPGVGKSCMLRYVASKFGGFCLRVKLAQLKELKSQALVDLVRLLRPNVLIIDDFDRFVGQPSSYDTSHTRDGDMLDPIEEIAAMVPLFMVSANYSNTITDALLRPGRFDEFEHVDQVDPDLYASMLPDAPRKLVDELKRLKAPVTHVLELKKRVEALGNKGAMKEMERLMKRADIVMNIHKRRERKNRCGPTLIGKSDRKKAAILEKRAARLDRHATSSAEAVLKWRNQAEDNREKAKNLRDTAVKKEKDAADAKAAKKSKPRKKKKAK